MRFNLRKAAVAGAAVLALSLSACGPGGTAPGNKEKLEMWFWGAPPAHQEQMQKVLVDGFNSSQDKYQLNVTFDNAVDKNIQVALAANRGPDVVYGSGPSFAAAYVQKGKLADLNPYAEKYGWKDRILAPMYESGTVNGKLYSLPNSLNNIGVFYNKKVLDQLGVGVPTTTAELHAAMDKAVAAGMYASVTGNKGWKPVNQNYASLFLTHSAGGKAVYDALQGNIPWTDPAIATAIEASREFFQNGYLAGKDYSNLNFVESMQLLSQGKAPFMFGPSLAFQFASATFNDEAGNTADLGFVPFPNVNESLATPNFTLGSTASLSVNAASKNQEGAAMVIDYMMTEKFSKAMTEKWPGYWSVPLKSFNASPDDFTGLSKPYVASMKQMIEGVNDGHYGFFAGTFFPPATATEFDNIDSVWLGKTSTADFLAAVDKTFQEEKAKGLVPPVPEPK
jgi:raffinose/stachyose/melibiose transport system substrate-binding protein